MALDPAELEALAPRATAYKATDGKGLYLLIQPNGRRYWRFRYRSRRSRRDATEEARMTFC